MKLIVAAFLLACAFDAKNGEDVSNSLALLAILIFVSEMIDVFSRRDSK